MDVEIGSRGLVLHIPMVANSMAGDGEFRLRREGAPQREHEIGENYDHTSSRHTRVDDDDEIEVNSSAAVADLQETYICLKSYREA